jgi:hypothetical protein
MILMSIYDHVYIGPNIYFEPDFTGTSDSVTVIPWYRDSSGAWKRAWDLEIGYASFCIPLRTWEEFQAHGSRKSSHASELGDVENDR